MAEALTNQAYDYLYEKIISCDYLPGQELSEKQLLEETGLGRTPLREALLALQKDNLVDIFPRRGMRVTPFTEKGIDDLYQTRKLIEPTVSTKYITLYSKSRLLEFDSRFRAVTLSDPLEEYRLDTLFHSYLIEVTGNDILTSMYRGLMIRQLRLAVYSAKQDRDSRTGNVQQHAAIIDALLRENEADARDAIVLHINHSLIKSLKMLQNQNPNVKMNLGKKGLV
ncbi:GntR family transcriptional regulator [Anaerolentibacter hominis]|uniref:GntR family transcriptional regulator n=1 Tax=Anaerolentibacter hominis TaxID=3079009 RepID=UPI0031B85BAC